MAEAPSRSHRVRLAALADVAIAVGLGATVFYFRGNALVSSAVNGGDVALYGILAVYYAWLASRVWTGDDASLRRSLRVNVLVFAFSAAHLVYMRSTLHARGVIGDAVFVVIARIRVPVTILHALAAAAAYAALQSAVERR